MDDAVAQEDIAALIRAEIDKSRRGGFSVPGYRPAQNFIDNNDIVLALVLKYSLLLNQSVMSIFTRHQPVLYTIKSIKHKLNPSKGL